MLMNDFGSYSRIKSIEKKRPFSITKLIALCFLLLIFVGGCYTFIQLHNYNEFITSKIPADAPGEFEVKEGDSLEVVTSRLVQEGFFPNREVFGYPAHKVYLKLNKLDSSGIQAGIYKIPSDSEIKDVFGYLRAKKCNEIRVTLIEGQRIEEFAEELGDAFAGKTGAVFSKDEFINEAKNFANNEGAKLSFAPPKNLEGYLFPDTYQFCSDSTTSDVLVTLLQTFNTKVYKPYESKIKASGLSLGDIVNFASMIEREARTLESKKMVSDILQRRVKLGYFLGVDATSQYHAGYSKTQKTWWRTGYELDNIIEDNDPYNTRKNLGLPPTPISNPGVNSYIAVLEPTKNDYLYYVTGVDNKMHYAKDLNGHNYNVCKFVTQTCR